jgi:hypothetical protein
LIPYLTLKLEKISPHYGKKLQHIKEMGGIGKPIPPKPLLRQNDATFMGIS